MLRWSRFNILNDMYRIHWVHEYTYTLIPLNTNTQRERHYRSIIIDILTFWTGLHLNSMWKWLIIITVFDELIGSELALHGWHIKNSGASMDTRLNKSYSHHIILYDSQILLKIVSLKVGMNFWRGFWLLMLFIPTYVLFSSTFWFEPEQKHTQKRLDNWLDLCMCIWNSQICQNNNKKWYINAGKNYRVRLMNVIGRMNFNEKHTNRAMVQQ